MLSAKRHALEDVSHSAVWEVSTAKTGTSVRNLIDGRMDTFWQSNSTVPHFITAYFEQRRQIMGVELYVDHSVDDTYTPRVILIRIGDHADALETVGELTLSSPDGWIWLELSPKKYLERCTRQFAEHPEADAANELLNNPELMEGTAFTCSIVQIGILANFDKGQDSHVRQVRILAQPLDAQ